jgi:two-component system, LytTR family, sensor kinase
VAGWARSWNVKASSSSSRYAVHDVLALASQASQPLRAGLHYTAATKAAPALRTLLDSAVVAVTDTRELLACEGTCSLHRDDRLRWAAPVLAGRGTTTETVRCDQPACEIHEVVVVPIIVDGSIVGTLQAFFDQGDIGTVRAVEELGRWVSTQVELGELERSRLVSASAQLRALRAQISPHFVFNALNTIASFVRTDPERARDLLMEFADFARYTFSSSDQFATLADELRAIDTYVSIERARFGDRLSVSIRVAPEVLGVPVPFLVLQPLVENALQHGLFRKDGVGALVVQAMDVGAEAVIIVEDDGVGMDPQDLEIRMAGQHRMGSSGFGLLSSDERLRTAFGSQYGLVVETGLGLGTKITIRIPKFRSQTNDDASQHLSESTEAQHDGAWS